MSNLVALIRSWLEIAGTNRMVLVMLGGAPGSLLRDLVGRWFVSRPWAQGFPYGTMFINVTGSFTLAVAAVIVIERLPPGHDHWFRLIGTGFCGGYTTFSTFEWETFKLVQDNRWTYALLNMFGSSAAGFAGVLLGVFLVNLLFPRQ